MNLVIVDVIVAKTLAAMASVATNVSAKNATVDATVLNAIAVPIRSAAMLAPVQIAKLSNFRIAVQYKELVATDSLYCSMISG